MWHAMNTYDLSDSNQDLSKILSVFILLVYPVRVLTLLHFVT